MTGMDALTDYTSTYLDNIRNQTNGASASKTAEKDFSTATEEELYEACKEFEAYFIEQVFKSMAATIPKEESSSSSALEMFESNMYQEYAKQASESGQLGLAQQLFEQMKRNYDL